MERLSDKELLQVCEKFIRGRGYGCKLDFKEEIISYLIDNNYIYEELPNYYFLNKSFYEDYRKEINNMNFTKIEVELLKNYCALNVIYFDGEIMHIFLNNPNYHFTWDGYCGYVCSTDNSKIDVYIKNLCMCHDLEDDKIILGAFIVDLIECSRETQIILQPYILEGDKEKYEFHHYNYKNLMLGKWLEINELDIYTIILEGIKIINYIFYEKYGFKLYKNEYELSELQFYMPLFFPTKINRFNFMMELAKIFLDNINGKCLKKLIEKKYDSMSNKNEFTLEDLKKEEFREYKTFKTYFKQYELFNELCFTKLDEIRRLRTEPAHKIYINDINDAYCNEQDITLKNLYRVIYNIIKVEDPDYNLLMHYQNGEYVCFYGDKGKISEYNGFNSKIYHYYNGYVCLINDKFRERDAEVLLAGNDINYIKRELSQYICNNYKLESSFVSDTIDFLIENEKCKPTKKELKSFFYGQAFMKWSYKECDDYKKEGKKMFEDFCSKSYKYVYVFADSSELIYDLSKTIENIQNNKECLFGSGLLLCSLSNNFALDESNIFNKKYSNILILSNVWD